MGLCLAAFNAQAAPSTAETHLLSGASYFREDRFDAALVEFRVAQKLGARDASWYVAASLVKLGRSAEAIEAFSQAEALAPAGKDALLEYYRALALYDSKLYASASRVLAHLCQGASPKIAQHAEKVRADIAKLWVSEPSATTLDWYQSRAAESQAAGQWALSAAYFAEAQELASRIPDPKRREERLQALKHLRGPAPVAKEQR